MNKSKYSSYSVRLFVTFIILSFFSLILLQNYQTYNNSLKSIAKGVQAAAPSTCLSLTPACFKERVKGMGQAEIDKAVAAAKAKANDVTGKTQAQIDADALAAKILAQADQWQRQQSASAQNSGLDMVGKLYYDSPKDLLPAYRWGSFPFNVTPDGGLLGGASTSVKSQISVGAGILFNISNLIWRVVIWLIDFAGNSSIILSMGQLIDNGYYAVATTFLGDNYKTNPINSFAFILMVMVFFTIFKRVLKGESIVKIFRLLMTFFIAMSVMYFFATTTENGAANQKICDSTNIGNGTDACVAYAPTKFTPAWIALVGTNTLNDLAGSIVTAPQIVKQVNSQELMIPVGKGNLYSCEQYVGYLYSSYEKVGAAKDTQGIKVSRDGTTITAQISMVWQRSFLTLWSQANFGSSSKNALQASCHYLEYHNGITPQEQILIGGNSYKPNGLNSNVYLLTEDSADQGYGIYPWMACQGEKIDPAWQTIFSYSENANSDGTCDSWRKNGPDKNFLHFSNGDDIDKAFTCAIYNLDKSNFTSNSALVDCPEPTPALDQAFIKTPQAAKELTDVRDTIKTYRGEIGASRTVLGFASILSSIGMGFILGIVSLGALAASFGLILMLIWLPVTLIMIVNDSRRGERSKGTGSKMLKFTISFMASKMVLMFALLIIVQLSVIIITAIDVLGV